MFFVVKDRYPRARVIGSGSMQRVKHYEKKPEISGYTKIKNVKKDFVLESCCHKACQQFHEFIFCLFIYFFFF